MKLKSLFVFLLMVSISIPIFAGKRYGLIIGSNYKGNTAKIPELGLCENDATYIKSQIQKASKFDNVKILLGNQVTKDNIKNAISEIASKAGADDTVFLYFAGHGFYQRDTNAKNGMRNYIVCYNRPHLSDDELNDYLKEIKSPKTVFTLDCCFSGGIAKKGKNTRGSQNVPIPDSKDGTVKQNSEDFYFQNKTIISSADDNQTAIEIGGQINHGIFTYNFGRALENADLNGDKVITALEAFYKTKEDTVAMAKQADHEQEPQISGNASGIFLSGEKTPEPPKPVKKPEPIITPTPEPQSDPVKPDPEKPVVTEEEPKVVATNQRGNLLITTTIIKDINYAKSDESPYELLNKGNSKSNNRNIKVLIDDKEYPTTISTVKSDYWGSIKRMGKLYPGELYTVLIKDIPAGVQKVTIKADKYPEIQKTAGIIPGKTSEMEIIASMSGYGAIKGKVFYKTLDNPVMNQPIYMPTITSVNGIQKTYTDNDGNFWFTNLKTGEYEIRASFAEPLDLANSMIQVREGEVTEVDIILNVKLKSTKTKY